MLGVVIQNRYEIHKHLRDDKLGSIYKGFDKKLDKNIAINILRENPGEELEFLMERVHFLYGLNHKNIVKFYDSGQEHKFYYLIYEYIDGFSLKDFISEYELKDPVYYSIYLCAQVCEALYYSHNNYIFHGDLNLDNILIASNGEIKLNNFGLMRLEPNLLEEGSENCIFFSPEQIKGEEVDARTDIYSLGSILYYLVSGQSVYSQIGKNLDKNINPLSKYNPAVPRPMESIIMKMLSKTPVERYQFVGKILNELSGIKYKSLKPLVQELFPQTDFSKFLSEKPLATVPLQLKTIGDQQPDGKMKLDFRLLDVICQATGVRYKEARDAIIETEGDVAAAIAIVRRKGEGHVSHMEDGIEIKPVAEEPVDTRQADIVSRLLFGYFIISGEKGDILFYFPAILLFTLLSVPFLFMLSPVIGIIVIVILIIGFLAPFFANLQPDIIDKDTFEFRKRVQMTLTHIATQELSLPPGIGSDSVFMQQSFSQSPVDDAVTVAPSREKVSPVKRSEPKQVAKEEKPIPSKAEKPQEVKDDIQEKIDHICSRVEGVTPDEARKALEEVDGDQTKAVMNLRRMKRQAAKAPPPEPPPPVREEKPPVREEKPPVREEKPSSKPVAGGKNFDPEKIDYVCRRTKVSEDEAVKALEENNGDEIEAVMSIKKKRRRRRE